MVTSVKKPPVLVVVQLAGGNDFMNTIVPFANPLYYDYRPTMGVKEDKVVKINDQVGFHPAAAPLKQFWDSGKMAIVQGIGYPGGSRSHFRSMYIWHTCEPVKISTEGWLGIVTKMLDPKKENVLTSVNFGRGLPQALVSKGVPVTSVGDLDNYGLMTGLTVEEQRMEALDRFKEMYAPAMGTGPVMDYLSETGNSVLQGAEIIKKAPEMYKSKVEYAGNEIARGLRDVARVHLADLGTRIFYVNHGGYDTHSNQAPMHQILLSDLTRAISDFFRDLRDHDAADNVTMLVFTEFGRRVADNGSGTDHGAGGGAFIIGDNVKGGFYAEYPSLKQPDLADGEDLKHTYDYRGMYASILEQVMGLDSVPIVNGKFEQLPIFK
ncbi:MAG: DUF1501 domain-containing protein [SAR202 cluster bacterium]|nr:DUF1501 domain-containing protein [SAR202 cluster bacterium]